MKKITISRSRLKKIVSRFEKSSVMVIGDSMIDEYLWGEVRRISPEAPVPVVEVTSTSVRLGGAANVVQNLSRIGVKPVLLTVCGNDQNGRGLARMIKDMGCSCEGIHYSRKRPTTVKTRILARNQQIVRADRELREDLQTSERKAILAAFETVVSGVQGVIISDYGKGVICDPVVKKVIDTCLTGGRFVSVDPKVHHFQSYRGVNVITPNLQEAHTMLGIPFQPCSDSQIREMGWNIVDHLDLGCLLITLGERGMALFEAKERRFIHLPTMARKVYDVTGAGDTVISIYSAAMTSGATPLEAAWLANHAAGLTVAELGTASVDPRQLLAVSLEDQGIVELT